MKTLYLFLFLIILTQVSAQSVQQLDAKYGYKGIKLDVPIATLSMAMSLVSTDGDYAKYFVEDDSYYNVGEAKLKACVIETITKKVFRIILQVEGTDNCKKLLESFVNAYGKPTKSEDDKSSLTYIWQSKTTTLSYLINLNDGINTSGFVLMYSKKMFDLDKKIQSQKSASDL